MRSKEDDAQKYDDDDDDDDDVGSTLANTRLTGPGRNRYRKTPPPLVFLLEVQYSLLKSLISTCVLSYVGSREYRLLKRGLVT